jgi:hypothetical protein
MRTVLALVLTSLSTVAAADVRNELAFGSSVRALRTDSANAVTEDSLGGGGFAYARELPLRWIPDLELWAVARADFGAATGTTFQTLTTSLDSDMYTLGARARYALLGRRIVANARVDVGVARTSLEMTDMNDHSASDSGWGGASSAALGLELLAVARASFSLGIRFEYGYVTATAVDLVARSGRHEEDTIELPRMESSLGHLDLGGRYFSFNILTQF